MRVPQVVFQRDDLTSLFIMEELLWLTCGVFVAYPFDQIQSFLAMKLMAQNFFNNITCMSFCVNK